MESIHGSSSSFSLGISSLGMWKKKQKAVKTGTVCQPMAWHRAVKKSQWEATVTAEDSSGNTYSCLIESGWWFIPRHPIKNLFHSFGKKASLIKEYQKMSISDFSHHLTTLNINFKLNLLMWFQIINSGLLFLSWEKWLYSLEYDQAKEKITAFVVPSLL